MLAQSAVAAALGSGPTPGLTDQWYVGLGGGVSFLQPNPVAPPIDPVEEQGSYGRLTIGRDLGRLASLQLQFHSMGEVALSNGEDATYNAVDAALLYRFFDTRDGQLVPTQLGLTLYGIAGLGGLSRETDSDLALKNQSEFFLSYGLGAEVFLNRHFSLRLQGAVVDEDAQYVSLSLVTRFGGTNTQSRNAASAPEIKQNSVSTDEQITAETAARPATTDPITDLPAPSVSVPVNPAPITPVPNSNPTPEAPQSRKIEDLDSDRDGVPDLQDECNDSAPEFPTRANGCPLFNGVLSAVKFEDNSARLLPESRPQLDALAKVLKNHPEARIQILVHTDTSINETEQAILTRGRIRTLGTYLLSRGIRANRLILRSMGGSVPVSDNSTPQGRAINNRIEVLEYR